MSKLLRTAAQAVTKQATKSHAGGGLLDVLPKSLIQAYRNNMASRLAEYGLKHDDILIETEDVVTAVSRMNHEEAALRQRRIKRAFDLSGKHEHMHIDSKNFNADDYLETYLGEDLADAEREREEFNVITKQTPW